MNEPTSQHDMSRYFNSLKDQIDDPVLKEFCSNVAILAKDVAEIYERLEKVEKFVLE